MTYVSSARHVWAFFKRGICTLSRAMDNISKFVAGCISMSVSVTFLNRNHKQMKISRLNVAYNIDYTYGSKVLSAIIKCTDK